MGGFCGAYAGQPFDTIKTRIQLVGELYDNSTVKCTKEIARTEGMMGFFKGITGPLAGMMFINAVVFGVEDQCMRILKQDTIPNHMISGAVAGLVQVPIVCPTELIKCRMQMQGVNSCKLTKPEYTNAIQGLIKLSRKKGIRECFKGGTYTILREVPSFSAYFGTYYGIQKKIGFKDVDGLAGIFSKDFAWSMFAGGTAGASCWLVSYPFDVLKTKIQIDGFQGPQQYKGSLDCYRKCVKKDGYSWAIKGLYPTLIRGFVVNCVTFSVTMLGKNIIEKYFCD